MVDIREVARRSGVSAATVSRALNGRPDVSEATRQRVLQTAKQLQYLPNQQARALVRRRSDTVGLIWDTAYVTTSGRVPFLQDLLVGLKMALADTGYNLLLLSPRSNEATVDDFVRIAQQHSLEGVALMAVDEHLPAVDALIASGRPCVGLDLPVQGPRATYVSADNRSGSRLAVEHLYALGHRRIATITGPRQMLPAAERYDGFRTAMAERGLEVPDGYVVPGDFFLTSGHAGMRQLMQLPEPPTAVLAAGDQMAVGAMNAVAHAGLSVPGDVSVVGFDDIEAAALVRPALTTITQDYLAMGRAAVDVLTELIATVDADGTGGAVGAGGELAAPSGPAPRRVRGRLTVRASTGPAPGG